MTESTLNIGTTTATRSDVVAISPPQSISAIGIPNNTKLLRPMPWIKTPRRRFSFSISGITANSRPNMARTLMTANRNTRPLISASRLVV